MQDTTSTPASDSPASAPASRRGGRAQRNNTPNAHRHAQRPNPRAPSGPRTPAAPVNPALQQLAALYPALFGPKPLPLKRGVMQELEALHPDVLSKDDLKLALTLHTRATRYLAALASGQARHDLQGQPVESVSPEHRYHALTELYRRRQHRSNGQDLSAELCQRITEAAEASGLTPTDYAAQVRSKNEAANALLDQAMAELTERMARDEARLRAFEASGKTVTEFADMYGLHPIETAATLTRAQARRA